MRKYLFWIAALLLALASCTTKPLPGPTTTSEAPPKQPEPSRPLIKGGISGLPDGTAVTIQICTPGGRGAYTVEGPSPGPWEAVVTDASGLDYVVTAETRGYASQPVSYTIRLSGDIAYVMRDGQVTDEEAVHLDFHFVPAAERPMLSRMLPQCLHADTFGAGFQEFILALALPK